jgi:site-specific recombinase XerD
MFDQVFTFPSVRQRQRSGPLLQERLAYLSHLVGEGMSLKSLRETANYLLAVADYLRLADRPGEAIARDEIVEQAARWANRRPRPRSMQSSRYGHARFLCYATRWLKFLDRLCLPASGPRLYGAQIAAFGEYLRNERGLSAQTIRSYCWVAQQFLDQLAKPGAGLGELTPAHIDQGLMDRVRLGNYARTTVQTYAGCLRAFFRYAEAQGWCRPGLAAAIESPRVFAQATLPDGPSWEQVKQLLAASAGDEPVDIRDRALLMLLAVYGLRAGEVVRLRLEDFDWERERLLLTRPKQRHAQVYPLDRSVGAAIVRYLREVRPRSPHRQVFLTLRAPFRPLGDGSLWSVVGRRLRALRFPLRHHGPHALRHACATHLLERGLSLKEIGDHLGHRDPDTTRIYAKVSLAALRQVAALDLGGLL